MLPAELAALAARRRYDTQSTAGNAWRLVRGLWLRMDQSDPAASWDNVVGPTAGRVMRAAQIAAATGAQQYVDSALEIQNIDSVADGTVVTNAYVGTASDGDSLDGLLRLPAQGVEDAVAQGMPVEAAMAVGESRLQRIVVTQTGDAGRVPVGVAIVAARHAEGWVRMVTPPACSRCIILAGKWYRSNEGFRRHPNCDCVHVPASEDHGRHYTTDPHNYFDQLTAEEQERLFTRAGAQAIRDGADMFQVVNARQKMRTVEMAGRTLKATGIGVTRRSLAGQRLGAGRKRSVIRLMPESLYQISRGNRDEALRLLRLHGYIL